MLSGVRCAQFGVVLLHGAGRLGITKVVPVTVLADDQGLISVLPTIALIFTRGHVVGSGEDRGKC